MTEASESKTIQRRIITEQECLETGGHCWENGLFTGYFTSPPMEWTQECRHCTKKQRGVYQESIRWEDADG